MYEFLDWRTHDVMSEDPVTIRPDESLASAQERFEKHGFNALPVVAEDGQLVGLLTKLDVLRAFSFDDEHMFPPYQEIMAKAAASVMTRDLRTVCPDTPLARVLEKLVSLGVKSLPVLDGDRLVGMVSREDVLEALRRASAGERPRGSWNTDEAS